MKVDIHNLKKAVARELSLHALLFKNTINNIVKRWRLFVWNRIHILEFRILPKKKYKSVMNEHSHKFPSSAVYGVFTWIISVVKVSQFYLKIEV